MRKKIIRPSLCFRDEDDWWVRGTRGAVKKKPASDIWVGYKPFVHHFLCLFFPFFFQFYYSVIIIIFLCFVFLLFCSIPSALLEAWTLFAFYVFDFLFFSFWHCLRSRRQRRLIHFRLCTDPNGNVPLQRRVNRKKRHQIIFLFHFFQSCSFSRNRKWHDDPDNRFEYVENMK